MMVRVPFRDMDDQDFPNIGSANVMDRPDRWFNCISWSVGITDGWNWPGYAESDFDEFNARYGFEPCDWDESVEEGVDKIVLYATEDRCTHQARQEKDGTWTSKLGSTELVQHVDLDEVAGGIYGEPIKMYSRRMAA